MLTFCTFDICCMLYDHSISSIKIIAGAGNCESQNVSINLQNHIGQSPLLTLSVFPPDKHKHSCAQTGSGTLIMSFVTLYTHTSALWMTGDQQEGRDTKSFTTHLQLSWVMASREEINSRRGDTIKAVHGPTSRYRRQVLIHKAGVSPPEQRERQRAPLLSLSGLWITLAYPRWVGGELRGMRRRIRLWWEMDRRRLHVVSLLSNWYKGNFLL